MARRSHALIAALSATVAILAAMSPLARADDASETCYVITYGYDYDSCGPGSCPDTSSSTIVDGCANGKVAARFSNGYCQESCVQNYGSTSGYYYSYHYEKKLSGAAAAGIAISVLVCCCGPLIIAACLIVAARKRRAAAAGMEMQAAYPPTYTAEGKPVYANAVDGTAGVPTPYVSPTDPAYGQQQYAQPQAYAYDAQQAPQQGAFAAAPPPGGAYYPATQGAPADAAPNAAYPDGTPPPYNATAAAPQYADAHPAGGPPPVAHT